MDAMTPISPDLHEDLPVKLECELTQQRGSYADHSGQREPRMPILPQRSLAPDHQPHQVAERLSAGRAGLRQIPAHRISLVTFQRPRENARNPPANASHDASQETPRLTRVTAV